MKCFFLFFLFFSLIDFLRVVFFPFYQRECLAKKFHSIKKLFFFAYLLLVWLFAIRRKRRRNKVEINKNYPSCAAAAPYNRRNKKTKKDHLHDSRTGVSHAHRESEEKNNTKRKDVFQIDRW
jgi:ABC-type nickel/cobalt efflux system permease component RcnA